MTDHPGEGQPLDLSPNPGSWLLLSLSCGLASGLLELGCQGILKLSGTWLRLSVHALWAVPLVQTMLLLGTGLGFVGLGRISPRLANAKAGIGVLTFLGFLPIALTLPHVDERASILLAAGLATQAGRAGGLHFSRLAWVAARTLPFLLSGVVSLGAGGPALQLWQERRALSHLGMNPEGPNVLLIILDAVRAADLGLYGYSRSTTPTLDTVVAHAALFEHAYAPAPWTLTSHASVLTGRWPHELTADWQYPLDGRFPTLAEVFRDAGYATGAFMANGLYTMPESGLSRGFIRFRTYPLTAAEVVASSAVGRRLSNSRRVRLLIGGQEVLNRKTASQVSREFIEWLDAIGRRPFFAVLNYYDAHEPYLPPAPFAALFGSEPIPFHLKTTFQDRHVELKDYVRRTLDDHARQVQQAAYDGAIAYQDSELGKLFDSLEQRGLLDGTVVVVTSDHGEGLGESDRFLHGEDLSNYAIHVPLLVRFPKAVPPRRIQGEVSLRDIPKTLLSLVGLRGSAIPGADLSAMWLGAPEQPRSPAFSSLWPPWGRSLERSWSLVYHGLHYIRVTSRREELYDLRDDPSEAKDLLQVGRVPSNIGPVLARMRGVVDSLLATTTASRRPDPPLLWQPESGAR